MKDLKTQDKLHIRQRFKSNSILVIDDIFTNKLIKSHPEFLFVYSDAKDSSENRIKNNRNTLGIKLQNYQKYIDSLIEEMFAIINKESKYKAIVFSSKGIHTRDYSFRKHFILFHELTGALYQAFGINNYSSMDIF